MGLYFGVSGQQYSNSLVFILAVLDRRRFVILSLRLTEILASCSAVGVEGGVQTNKVLSETTVESEVVLTLTGIKSVLSFTLRTNPWKLVWTPVKSGLTSEQFHLRDKSPRDR